MIDIGANLTKPGLMKNLKDTLLSAKEVGVSDIIITGTSIQSTQEAKKLANDNWSSTYPNLYYTAGIHPHSAHGWDIHSLHLLETLAEDAVAVGECGLDYNRMYSPKEDQIRVFIAQLDLALASGLPVFLHERDAFQDFVGILKPYCLRGLKGVVHCFTGDTQEAKAYLDMGLYIGVTGWITDSRRNKKVLEALTTVPLDKLMIETDSPYLIPRNLPDWHKKEACLPQYLPYIASALCEAKGVSFDQILKSTSYNARTLFDL